MNPQADSYTAASGVTAIYGGRSGPLPAWLAAIPAGQWGEIASSTLTTSGVGWAGTSPGGTGNYTTIVTAWGGGILNTVGIYRSGAFVPGTFLVLFGGGHGDYAGNELYAFGPLENDAPTWSRMIDPTLPAPDDVARLGGYPVSRHTYDTLVYLPDQNKMLCIGTPGYYHTGSNFNVADVFDFAVDPTSVNPWSTADTGFPAYAGGGTGAINLISGYDSATGRAWGLGSGNGQRIGYYTAATGAWADSAIDNPSIAGNSRAGLSPTLSLMVSTDAAGNPIVADLRATPALFSPSTTGTGPGVGGCAFGWDSTNSRFSAWAKTGKTIYHLTPGANPYSGGDAWAWSSESPSVGATPATQTTNGTFGRFQRVESLGGFLLMPTELNPICFFRDAA